MDSDNVKKILCYNILSNNRCSYGNKCMFAHSLEEQKKENYKDFIINFILKEKDLSNINICSDTKLLEELLIFTKECKNCLIKKCNGGYNCKYGTCLSNLKICKNDLINGKCKKEVDKSKLACINGIHLTEKKFIPYNLQLYTYPNSNYLLCENNNNINNNRIILNDENMDIIKEIIMKSNINDINTYDNNFEIKNKKINKLINYSLNSNSNSSDEESINKVRMENNNDINIVNNNKKINW